MALVSQGPTTVELNEDTLTALNGFTVSDPTFFGPNPVGKFILHVDHGTLNVDPLFLAAVTISDSGRTITSTLANFPALNTVLATVTYQPDQDYFGPDIFSILDGYGRGTDDYLLDVKPVNDAPVIVSDGGSLAQMSLLEGTTFVTKVVAVDVENDPITYKISGGVDASLFEINSKTGKLSFINAPDFKHPADKNGDNSYLVTVKATDGTDSDTQDFIIGVVKDTSNKAPVIVSDGGGDAAALSVAENTTAVTIVQATDENAGTKLKYSISGGADAAKFEIDPVTGSLSFNPPPDFENPTDAGADNVYDVVVKVSDGKLADTQAIAVTITDAAEPPVITSNGGGNSTYLYHPEGVALVTTVTAKPGDQPGTVKFSIAGGKDADKFMIDANTGGLSFVTPPTHATPTDANGDNHYHVVVAATHGSEVDVQSVTVAVDDAQGVLIIGTPGRDKVNAHKTVPGQPDPTEHGDIILGGHNKDVLKGLGGDDIIFGGFGSDILKGGKGNDLLIDGRGHDIMKGGAGSDMFLFEWGPQRGKVAELRDFKPGVDTIALDHDYYPALPIGTVADDLFHIGKKAKDHDDRLGYIKKTGKVWYDPDGKGGEKAFHIAKLDKQLDLHADDFLVA
ncbi:MAG: cadherin domain-containing protein [Bauldia sp.]|uniref:cadherin domain-containing protein n=1 Tax=Bauldia sp. TaxID=2575872 RepID=UPI001D33F2F8|nr:cadherin domain-containing protein [Bauldia sp.]MCB1497129.1 cadherin domain-containing protein [Bauldia sp.]